MNKVYTENININLKNVENVEKLLLIEKNKKTYSQVPNCRGGGEGVE